MICLETFLGTSASGDSCFGLQRASTARSGPQPMESGFSFLSQPTPFEPLFHQVTSHSPMRPPIRLYSWYRNINRFSIAYPFRTQLRTRLTLLDEHRVGTLGFSAKGILTLFLATQPACSLLTAPLLFTSIASTLIRTLSYHLNTFKSTASVSILAPLYFSAQNA